MNLHLDFVIYALRDSHGDAWTAIVEDESDDVHVYSIRDDKGNVLHFESEAYHLGKFASDNKLEYFSEKRQCNLILPDKLSDAPIAQ